ncbi:hypothetical protein [Halosolutus gelatinilyticus]|uniref:hypothetical protein n=1 Tax=Halosolutus gelatinilyticus TaxID=2931975 RepID=UPI001FF1EBC9|nr:hypothetical protein [Halosolutus gelatinilyticus]
MTPPPLFLTGKCHPNKSAMQLYVAADVVESSDFPLEPEDDYRGMTVPGTDAVLLWPKGCSPEFPLEVDDYSDELVPWPLKDRTALTNR